MDVGDLGWTCKLLHKVKPQQAHTPTQTHALTHTHTHTEKNKLQNTFFFGFQHFFSKEQIILQKNWKKLEQKKDSRDERFNVSDGDFCSFGVSHHGVVFSLLDNQNRIPYPHHPE